MTHDSWIRKLKNVLSEWIADKIKQREWIWKVECYRKNGEEKWLLIKKLWRELNNY